MRSALALTSLSIVAYGVVELWIAQPISSALLFIKAVQIATVVAVLLALARRPPWTATVVLGIATAAEICVTLAASGVLTREIASTPLLLILVTLVTGSFVPWGLWPQVATVAAAIVALAWNAAMVPLPPNFGYSLVAAGLAFAASAYVAWAFERHRLVEWMAEEDARQSARELRYEMAVTGTVARVSQEVVAALDAPALVERLCELTVEALGCDAGYAFLRDDADGAFVAVAGAGDGPDRLAWLRSRPVPGIALTNLLARLATGEVVAVTSASPTDVLPVDAATTLCVALRRGHELVGILVAAFRTSRPARADEPRRVLAGIARVGSMALAQARLTAELARASHAEVAFLADYTREIETAFAALRALAGDAGDAATRVRLADAIADAILDGCALRAIDAADLRTTAVPLASLWASVHATCERLPRAAVVGLEWTELTHAPTALTDGDKLGAIVRTLVGDALARSSAGAVAVALEVAPSGVALHVDDGHVAVPVDDAVAAVHRAHAAMRLHVARRLVHQLGGELALTPAGAGSPARATVRLPVRLGALATGRAA
jgi:signal transduction histidine kinase